MEFQRGGHIFEMPPYNRYETISKIPVRQHIYMAFWDILRRDHSKIFFTNGLSSSLMFSLSVSGSGQQATWSLFSQPGPKNASY